MSALPLEALLRAEPHLRGVPVVVVESDAPRAAVLHASPEAAALGVQPGMSASAARAASVALVVRPVSPGLVRSALEAVCDLAAAHALTYERTTTGVLLPVGDLGRLYPSEAGLGAALWAQSERFGLRTQVGIAAGPRLAEVAARSGPGVTVVPTREARRFMAGLPIDALDPATSIAELLRSWGVRTAGDLAALPRPPLALRLGAAGVQLHRLACGEDETALRSTPPPLILTETLDLDDEVDNLEPLGFILRGLLDRLVARLAVRGLACRDYTLRLDLSPKGHEQRPVQVVAPTRDVTTLLRLGRLALQSLPPAAPVRRVSVLCRPCAPRPAQLDLFVPTGPSPEQLSTLLARMQALVGDEGVGAPAVVDTHLLGEAQVVAFSPGQTAKAPRLPRLPVQRLGPHLLRPPRPAEVILMEGRPVSFRSDLAAGDVRRCGAPHRVRIGWGRPALRDYYDVELGDGGLWRLFQDLTTNAWFLEAKYE